MFEIRQSPIHGYGVFAQTDIKMGTILTYYDGKVLPNKNILAIGEDVSDDDAFLMINNSSYVVPLYNNLNTSSLFEELRSGNNKPTMAIFGYTYEQIQDWNKVGSLINDGLWDGDIENYRKLLPEYTRKKFKGTTQEFINEMFDENGFLRSPTNINCCFKSECIQRGLSLDLYINKVEPLAVIAKRDIKAGEELLMIYGIGYWEEEELNKLYLTDRFVEYANQFYNNNNFNQIREIIKIIRMLLLTSKDGGKDISTILQSMIHPNKK